MKIPELSSKVKEFFQYILKRSKYSDGLMYIGDYKGGYVFSHKMPKNFKGMIIGERSFLYVKDDLVYAVDRCVDYCDPNDMFYEFCGLLNSVNEDKCYTITLEDDK